MHSLETVKVKETFGQFLESLFSVEGLLRSSAKRVILSVFFMIRPFGVRSSWKPSVLLGALTVISQLEKEAAACFVPKEIVKPISENRF